MDKNKPPYEVEDPKTAEKVMKKLDLNPIPCNEEKNKTISELVKYGLVEFQEEDGSRIEYSDVHMGIKNIFEIVSEPLSAHPSEEECNAVDDAYEALEKYEGARYFLSKKGQNLINSGLENAFVKA